MNAFIAWVKRLFAPPKYPYDAQVVWLKGMNLTNQVWLARKDESCTH